MRKTILTLICERKCEGDNSIISSIIKQTTAGAVAERLRRRSREKKVPSSILAWASVLRRLLNANFHRIYMFNVRLEICRIALVS